MMWFLELGFYEFLVEFIGDICVKIICVFFEFLGYDVFVKFYKFFKVDSIDDCIFFLSWYLEKYRVIVLVYF